MYKNPSKSQYHIGNDRPIPDSAFNLSSYVDGIYTEFDPKAAPNGWADIQQTYKMKLPQDKWSDETKYHSNAASGLVNSGIFSKDYNYADSEVVSKAFDLPESGRSTYVDGIPTEFKNQPKA